MRPTFRCVLLFTGAIPIALLPVFLSARWLAVWIAWMGLCVLATGIDAAWAFPARRLKVVGRGPRSLFVGSEGTLEFDFDPSGVGRRALVDVLVE